MKAAPNLRDSLMCGRRACVCRKGSPNHCPAHDDANPSLSITEKDGKILFRCHSGCDQRAVLTALKDRGLLLDGERTPEPRQNGRAPANEPDALYRYVNADGDLVAEHGRWGHGAGKRFGWRLPNGKWAAGLDSLPISSLPLYNLPDVIRHPDATVYVVEGEKAVGALRDRGLVAVCLGGGASQQMFGNALDPLADRDVILWPDNDEPGRALMGRLANLLPRARSVSPPLPDKGDAWDYFEGGGTVDGLLALVNAGEPTATMTGPDSIRLTYPVPAAGVTIDLSGITVRGRDVNTASTIRVERSRREWTGHWNLTSPSTRATMRRELEAMFKGREIDWTTLLAECAALAERTFKSCDLAIDLSDVLPVPRQWSIDRFAPLGLPTILFGMGDAGKGWLTCYLALCLLRGEDFLGRRTTPSLGVLVVDYEDQPDEWKRRVDQLCAALGWAPPAGLHYLSGRAIPFADQIDAVRAIVERRGIDTVIVDSAVSACGGDLLDTQAAQRLCNTLVALNVTSYLIAHTVKDRTNNKASTMYPYGNIFWHNLPRVTHYIDSRQEYGSRTIDMDIWQRKGNRGKQPPIAVRITFDGDDGPVSVELAGRTVRNDPAASDDEFATDGGHVWAIAEILEAGAFTVAEIAEQTGIRAEKVRQRLNARKSDLFVQIPDTYPPKWGRQAVREA